MTISKNTKLNNKVKLPKFMHFAKFSKVKFLPDHFHYHFYNAIYKSQTCNQEPMYRETLLSNIY